MTTHSIRSPSVSSTPSNEAWHVFGSTQAASKSDRPVVLLGPRAEQLPDEFVDLDDISEEYAKEEATRDSMKRASQAIADAFYGDEGRTLRYVRLKLGLSQKQVAEKLGTAQPYYSRIENGPGTNMQFLTAVRLAELFGCDMNSISEILHQTQKAFEERES